MTDKTGPKAGVFAELLGSALAGINDEYDQAKSELDEVVAEVGKAVDQLVAPRKVALRLAPIAEDPNETVFRLTIRCADRRDAETTLLGDFRIGREGTIQVGQYDFETRSFFVQETISPHKIDDYFKQTLRDRSSPLVTYVAFLKRHNEPSPAA